ncbi:MAG: dihydroorotase [Bacteroidia bacterium]|nr:dihydroorotase [Bacteroidia bacterium]
MKLLISSAEVIDLNSPFHGKICDILVTGGVIEKITVSTKSEPILPKGYKLIKAKNQYVMPGLFDMRADFCDPGFEHKETLESGAKVALSGGFTDVALLPSTNPPRDSKIGIDYVKNKSKNLPIHLHPYGCLSKDRNGVDISEMYDMFSAGAVGFTDGNRSVQHSGLLLRALMYNKIFGGLCLVYPEDKFLSEGGKMHEGEMSTSLGLKGVPSLAEELMVHRDIELAKYSQGRLHFSGISSKGSVELIRKAKKQGVAVSADVCFANLCYTDESLKDYDSNFKLVPHIRGKADQKALWEGIQDGTIDAIVSNHQPQDKESKQLEFEYALPGIISLQTMFPVLWQQKPKSVSAEKLVQALSSQPRNILEIAQAEIKENSEANFVLFNPSLQWTYEFNHSKSENTPLLKTKITGAITHVACKNQLHTHV